VQHALRKAAEAGDVKSALRKLQLRWHPDKWAQRFASRLAPDDADRVLKRVNQIAQIVNGLKAST
jgi:DnaJ-class molecular chaperone